MYKKIYSLLAGLILLSACTAEDAWNDKDIVPVNETNVTFSMNIPTATQTRSATAVDAEKAVTEGVEDLRLFTFDSEGKFIDEVKPTPQTVGYKALIDKKTTSIHFIANFGTSDLGLVKGTSTVNDLINIETTQYVFWGKADLLNLTDENDDPIAYDAEAGNSDIGTISLYRNWAKFNLSVNTVKVKNLFDVHYMIYNRATNSRIGVVTDKVINTPVSTNATFESDDDFVAAGEHIYPFENSKNNSSNPTFIIIRAKYGNINATPGYYKLDLSSKDLESGATVTHDVIRNHLYNVTIEGVAMPGVSWAEVTNPNKLPDNNITAAIELDDYPKISYENETLEVEKTTFVFTEYSDPYELNMWATYNLGNNLIKILPDDIEDVINGDIEDDRAGNIWAELLPINENDPNFYKEGYFYVIAGKLQRKIKIVLRKAYSFEFEADPNSVGDIQGTDIELKFRMSEKPDASIFPLECRIRTTKLYAVEDGVRIQPNGNGTYDYIYTAQEYQEEYKLAFKTNSSDSNETISLSAEYFNTATTSISTYVAPDQNVSILSTLDYYYTSSYGSNWNESGSVSGNVTLSYTSAKKGSGTSILTVSNGKVTSGNIQLPPDVTEVKLSFTKRINNTNRTLTDTVSIGDLENSRTTITLRN